MNANALREPRIGALIHYSAGDFVSTVDWCRNPTSKVSYNAVIAPDGAAVQVVPWELRAWHAGVCRPSTTSRAYTDANSAFYGIALAGGPTFGPPADAQRMTLNSILHDRFEAHGWPVVEWWRIASHGAEAWPRGRKEDPEGPDKANPWLSLDDVRSALAVTAQ